MSAVTIYSTPTCPWCHRAKEFLIAKKVEFTDINVAADYDAALSMIEKSGQRGVPVLEINGKIIVGYDPEAIEEALATK